MKGFINLANPHSLYNQNFMKNKILILVCVCFCLSSYLHAQSIIGGDPLVAGVLGSQLASQASFFKQRKAKQEEIISQELATNGFLSSMQQMQRKTLDYMQNANGLIKNLHQFKRIGVLVTEIPESMNALVHAVPENWKGALMGVINDRFSESYAEMASLIPVVEKVCKGSSFGDNVDDGSVNLLNSAERYQMLNSVVSRLDNINCELKSLERYIRTISLAKTLKNIAPDLVYQANKAQNIADQLKADWKCSHKGAPQRDIFGF